ncbi:hypothetical protein ACS0TY_022648 [Phlomoides rotata]
MDAAQEAQKREALRESVVNTLKRHLFLIPSFDIYSGIDGPRSYGPPGCAVEGNVLAFWRQHFVLKEHMLEVQCPSIIPEVVLKASGHVDKSTDLMFQTSIDPSGLIPGYMRPETAQGIFVNFNDLYHANDNKLPFAAAQIGKAFRNEICPPQGLLRHCEFTLAEIEHFVDPENKSHPKFSGVSKLEIFMFPRDDQVSGRQARKMLIGEAVYKGIIGDETLGYFIGRVYLFLTCLGIDTDRLRFRQHLANEMEHYAVDCWDAEIESSYGWIMCVGIADRSTYDLLAHSAESGVPLEAHEKFAEPREVQSMKMNILSISKGKKKEHLPIKKKKEKEKEHLRVFTPSVTGSSFVIERIIYCLYEHLFHTRASKDGDKQQNVFRFPPLVAPIKCTVFPLGKNQQYEEVAKEIAKSLTALGISKRIDITGTSIGKRYAITDELGVPLAIAVDSTSSVIVRYRDSKEQVRVDVDEVASLVKEVIDGVSWANVLQRYPTHPS